LKSNSKILSEIKLQKRNLNDLLLISTISLRRWFNQAYIINPIHQTPKYLTWMSKHTWKQFFIATTH